MIKLLILSALLMTSISGWSDVHRLGPVADTFVRSAVPNANYGGAGALNVSGSEAVNGAGIPNGRFDTFMRFNTGELARSMNAAYGQGNWFIHKVVLFLNGVPQPSNSIFNRGDGRIEVRWIANDSWAEGSGRPNALGSTGLTFQSASAVLDLQSDLALGAFEVSGADTGIQWSLDRPLSFVNDLIAGTEVSLYLTALDAGAGITFNSRSIGGASARPFLEVSALPLPRIQSIRAVNDDVMVTVRNGLPGRDYTLLASSRIGLPVGQWTPVSTARASSEGLMDFTALKGILEPAIERAFFLVLFQPDL